MRAPIHVHAFTSTAAVTLVSAALLVTGLLTAPASAGRTQNTAATTAIRVNQLGYLPDGPKRATVVSSATEPFPWQLRDSSGVVVASGTTTVHGADQASGQSTQLVDFGAYTATGTGYTLAVDGRTSHPFDISASLYDGLRSDSMSFFYQQRSGIAIDAALAGDAYARPAGHVGRRPEQGGHQRPLPGRASATTRLDVQRRLVRRGRPGQVRRQRRHIRVGAGQFLRAGPALGR